MDYKEGVVLDTFTDANRKCGYCGEEIEPGIRRCPHCCSLLENRKTVFNRAVYIEDVPAGNGFYARNAEMAPYASRAAEQVYAGKRLGNGKKVFITALCSVIPGFGQLAGVIISILLMNNMYDEDRRSFGGSLLAASIILFILSCFFWMVVLLALFTAQT